MFDVFVVGEVDFFWEEEAFLHADAEVSDSFDFLALFSIADGELGNPHAIDKFFVIFDDVIEDYV